MKFKLASLALAGACLCAALMGGPALAQTQGVSKDQIIIGSIQDLSGPVAGLSKPVKSGMEMRAEEINQQGGVNGRKLVLKFEDSGYDPKRAVLAAQKLIDQDKIFIMMSHTGSASNIAAFPVLSEKNVINFFPVASAREMYEPLNRLKYAYSSTYYDQVMQTMPRLVKEKNARKVCVIYQDDDFGQEVMRGTDDGLKTIGMALSEKASFKRGATDFSSQVSRMKAAGCDFVVLGTIIRETVGVMTQARKLDFNPTFFSTSAAYADVIHKLGGKAVDGLYASMTVQQPYLDDDSPALRAWADKYKAKFNEAPQVYAVYGYNAVDIFAKVALKAGPDLTTDSFIKAMDSTTLPPDMFGAPEMSFSPTKHLGSNQARISQIRNGRWQVVSGYAK